jgi:hypothetical protein
MCYGRKVEVNSYMSQTSLMKRMANSFHWELMVKLSKMHKKSFTQVLMVIHGGLMRTSSSKSNTLFKFMKK